MQSEELNSLDLEVKRMMLAHPSIFPSRLECLHHLFAVNGNACTWVDGKLVNPWEADEVMPEHIDPPEPYNFAKCSDVMEESEKIRLEYEGVVRDFTEKHIDYLCQDIHHTNCRMSFTSMYPLSWDYCAMGKAADNPESIHPDWRAGIRELIHWYLPLVNGYYGCYDDPDRKDPNVDLISDPRVKSNYELCRKVLSMMQTDDDRIKTKRSRKQMRKMIHDIE